MDTKIEVSWKDAMAFEANVNDHRIMLDAKEAVGGQNKGPQPKPLSLASLGGCTGMDVISILRKMRVEPEAFSIQVSAHNTDEHPKHYDKIHITYRFKGKNLSKDKLEKAVKLSQEKYCGVSHMLGARAKITHEIIVE